ncbi:hypothetical protein IWQ60_004259 [Tieghemiomyces parasiticus]|uniref:Transmembrane protein 188 n=1 Tax=Tieghemiomyces parasiticus TaxID=78921 RepID=A0A9W8A7G1_9FUNG|nr:hypothetical protein IWQ60_005183 [Tieghemiomyces parasiticus]KAJ1925919.1 hypothetical protein IWQ60_004259 [Tieghemiomyces parasiticus]
MSRPRATVDSGDELLRRNPLPPQPNAHLYKDLLIFEERLKQNVRRLKRKKRKYRLQLGCLLTIIMYLLLLIFLETNTKPWSFLYKYAVVACSLTFYWQYKSRKYTQTTKYIPQVNHSLRIFNMRLDVNSTHREGKLNFFTDRVPPVISDGFQAFKALYFQRKRSMSLASKSETQPRKPKSS